MLGVTTSAAALADVFGQAGTTSPVPANTAQYLLDLEKQDVYLHYCGPKQLFSLRFSPKFKAYLQDAARGQGATQMPVVYSVSDLSPQGTFNWGAASVPRWSATSGADSKHVFYGREIRDAQNALYGNSIHLVLGPEEDPEGWTSAEMDENRKFGNAILNGMSVGAADQYRQFRKGVAPALGSDFVNQFGAGVTTKAHRFALQMYSADSQSEAHEPGSFYFEMFSGGKPPTANVLFLEAEDGCKGTPTPKALATQAMQKVEVHGKQLQAAASRASRNIGTAAAAGCAFLMLFGLASFGVLRCSRIFGERLSSSDLEEEAACE